MKKWFARLFGGAGGARPDSRPSGPASGPTSGPTPAPAAAAIAEATPDIDLAFFLWLAGPHVSGAPSGAELVLDELARLGRDPLDAASLVPRVPAVIPQLLRSLRDQDSSSAELARQLAQDAVLVAEVIREANSAYYRPLQPVKSLDAALMMIGQNGLRMLLARIAFRPLIQMQEAGFARQAAPAIWNQSEKCALAASLMAPGLGAGVFESYLAGLMQNLGLIVALRLAGRADASGKIPGSSEFGLRLFEVSRQLSATIAGHWEFPQDVVDGIAGVGRDAAPVLSKALARGDQIAKLRLLLDAHVLDEDDVLVADGLDNFERRCLGKLGALDGAG
jgi:HD-like signal output (HDOD) protein